MLKILNDKDWWKANMLASITKLLELEASMMSTSHNGLYEQIHSELYFNYLVKLEPYFSMQFSIEPVISVLENWNGRLSNLLIY